MAWLESGLKAVVPGEYWELLTSSLSRWNFFNEHAINVLEIQYIIAKIWLSVHLIPFECALDAFMSDFEAAVELAEQLPTIARMHDQGDRYSNTFTLDIEVIGPIHWVSVNCRDPVLRRRALAVQQGTRRQESLRTQAPHRPAAPVGA